MFAGNAAQRLILPSVQLMQKVKPLLRAKFIEKCLALVFAGG